jgi:predicted ATPase
MLTKLRLKNFKSWEDTGEMRLAPFTGLFGTNSSGKSSILQALLLLKQTAESYDDNQVLNLGNNNTYVDLGMFRDIVHNKDEDNLITLGLQWEFDGQLITIPAQGEDDFDEYFHPKAINLVTNIGVINGQLNLFKFVYSFKEYEVYSFGMTKTEIEQPAYDVVSSENYKLQPSLIRFVNDPNLVPIKSYGFPRSVIYNYNNAYFLSALTKGFEETLQKIHYLGPLRDYPQRTYLDIGGRPKELGKRGEGTIQALLASRSFPKINRGAERPKQTLEEIVAEWLKKLRLVESFRLKPIAENRREYEVLVKRHNDSTEVLLSEVGFGVSQILPILVLCYYAPEGSTILLEQPEIHLHPSVQGGLADVFIDVIKNRNIQLIVESHSEHLLERLQRRIAEEVITKDETALYFCRAGEGRSEIEELQLNEYGEISNWPEDFFGDPMGDLAARTLKIIERQQAALAESQKVAASS